MLIIFQQKHNTESIITNIIKLWLGFVNVLIVSDWIDLFFIITDKKNV